MKIVLEQHIDNNPETWSHILVGTVYDSLDNVHFKVQINMAERTLADATRSALELISRGGVPADVLKKEIPVTTIEK